MNIGDHHVSVRKRVYTKLEGYPHPNKLRRSYDVLMYAVGIVAPLALLPQVLDVYIGRNVAGLSAITWTLLAIMSVLWAGYGMLHRAYPVLITNVGMAVLNFSIVVGILAFG